MKSVCLIPARGGSKRIPRKNIKSFFGKPLIAWSINAAKSSGIFDEVYVSTDDEEIANVAMSYGAIIPFIRPDYLSNDYAIDQEVIDHFIQWMISKDIFADKLCYLYATAPFINEEILINVRDLLDRSGAYLAHTVTTYDYPPLKALKQDEHGFVNYMWDEFSITRTQDLPELIHDAGQCYFYNLKNEGSKKNIVGYSVPRLFSQDIDTLDDFKNAEILFSLFRKNHKNK